MSVIDFFRNYDFHIKEAQKYGDVVCDSGINKILVCGMGGSALPGSILQSILQKSGIPVFVNRDYAPPSFTDEKTLVFVISYSGNTEETLSAFEQTGKKNIIGISSGGKLEELCNKNSIPHIKVPSGFQPRNALPYQTFPMLNILKNSTIIEYDFEKDVKETTDIIKNNKFEQKGKDIAEQIFGTIPVFYSSQKNDVIARIMKIQVNENSKIAAFWNTFPELNHNEINAYIKEQDFSIIILKDDEDHERIRKRMEITESIIKDKVKNIINIDLLGSSILSRIFTTIAMGNFISYYLAEKNNVDPEKVEMVEDFKKRMNK